MSNLFLKLHLYAGLQTFVGLLVYSVTTVVASLQPLAMPPAVEQGQVSVRRVAGIEGNPKQVARKLMRRLGWSMSKPPWAINETDGVVSFVTQSPNADLQVAYNRANGQATITTSSVDFGEFLIRLHLSLKLDPRGNDPRLVAWGWFNLVSGLALLFLTGSGVYLFAVAKNKPWYAWAALAGASATFAFAVLGLR